MAAVPDFGSFSTAQKQELLAACQAELLRRVGLGSIQTGSSTGESFGMYKVPQADLVAIIDGLTIALGYPATNTRVQPNFAGRGAYYPPCG